MNQVHNEQTKFLATGVNNVAVACIVIGFVTPISSMGFGAANAPPLGLDTIGFAVAWLLAGSGIHWLARRTLRSLKP